VDVDLIVSAILHGFHIPSVPEVVADHRNFFRQRDELEIRTAGGRICGLSWQVSPRQVEFAQV
jgi:hypothetical protein